MNRKTNKYTLLGALVIFIMFADLAMPISAQNHEMDTANIYRSQDYKFSIQFPVGWEIQDGDASHIIKKATDEHGSLIMVLVISLKNILESQQYGGLDDFREDVEESILELSANDISDKDFEEAIGSFIEGVLEAYQDVKILERKMQLLGDEKAAYVKVKNTYMVSGANLNDISVFYATIHNGLVYWVGAVAPEERFPLVEQEILSSVESFVFEDWNSMTSQNKDEQSSIVTDLILRLILGLILTWGIGLFIPLILRFLILKRPIERKCAIIVVVILWFANFILFTTLGSESKTHFALFMVAYASYLILHKGFIKDSKTKHKASFKEKLIKSWEQGPMNTWESN